MSCLERLNLSRLASFAKAGDLWASFKMAEMSMPPFVMSHYWQEPFLHCLPPCSDQGHHSCSLESSGRRRPTNSDCWSSWSRSVKTCWLSHHLAVSFSDLLDSTCDCCPCRIYLRLRHWPIASLLRWLRQGIAESVARWSCSSARLTRAGAIRWRLRWRLGKKSPNLLDQEDQARLTSLWSSWIVRCPWLGLVHLEGTSFLGARSWSAC